MPRDLDSKVKIYAAMIDSILEYEEDMEIYAALNWRDGIKESLDAGETLDTENQNRLTRADEMLIAKRDLVVSRFPHIFHPQEKGLPPRSQWWWYLDEGPQVRAQALAAARSG